MKIYAQHGSQTGEKITAGLRHGILDGVIYGAKDISGEKLRKDLEEIATSWPDTDRMLDPHYFATLMGSQAGARLGYLIGDKGHGYFRSHMRRDLEQSNAVIQDIRACLEFQATLPLTAFIAPNIVVRRTLDSVEGVIAKNFIRSAASVAQEIDSERELYVTLAISLSALADKSELEAFLQEVTELDNPPAGFYLILEKLDTNPLNSLTEQACLSRWMLINHTLKVSGFKVISGYTDLLAPYIAATGVDAIATGWFSTLKIFSLSKFAPNEGFPVIRVPRYTSVGLLKSIRHTELHALRGDFPALLNQLPTDIFYDPANGSLPPDAAREVMQNWEAVKAMMSKCRKADTGLSLESCFAALDEAEILFAEINRFGFPLRERSNNEHISAIRDELNEFIDLAEL